MKVLKTFLAILLAAYISHYAPGIAALLLISMAVLWSVGFFGDSSGKESLSELIWLVGQYQGRVNSYDPDLVAWDLVGVYHDRQTAVDSCPDRSYFVEPLVVGESCSASEQRPDWIKPYYPHGKFRSEFDFECWRLRQKEPLTPTPRRTIKP